MKPIAVSFLYQIFVPSFYDADGDGVGDLRGVKERTPYLERLGVECALLSGIFETTDQDSEHAITDHKRINPQIGMESDMTALIAAFHEKGIKVGLTLPVLATSTSHVWFEKAARAQNDYNLYRDYYLWAKGSGSNAYKPPKPAEKGETKRYAYHEEANLWYECTAEGAPILNMNNPRVRREFTDAIEYWKELGIDAICLSAYGSGYDDAPKSVSGKPPERRGYVTLLHDITERVSDAPAVLLSAFPTFEDEEYEALLADGSVECVDPRSFLKEIDLLAKEKCSIRDFLSSYASAMARPTAPKQLLAFEDGNHKRLISKIAEISDQKSFVAAGRSLATLFFTSPGIPMIYQGQEIGMTDERGNRHSLLGAPSKSDAEHAYRNLPFQWDNVRNAGFSHGPYLWKGIHKSFSFINANSEASDPGSILNHYARMIAVRKDSETLRSGSFRAYYGADKNVIAFTRETEDETLFVVCSLSSRDINYPLPKELLGQGFECILSTYEVVSRSMHSSIGLRPFEARIYSKKTEKDVKLLH